MCLLSIYVMAVSCILEHVSLPDFLGLDLPLDHVLWWVDKLEVGGVKRKLDQEP